MKTGRSRTPRRNRSTALPSPEPAKRRGEPGLLAAAAAAAADRAALHPAETEDGSGDLQGFAGEDRAGE